MDPFLAIATLCALAAGTLRAWRWIASGRLARMAHDLPLDTATGMLAPGVAHERIALECARTARLGVTLHVTGIRLTNASTDADKHLKIIADAMGPGCTRIRIDERSCIATSLGTPAFAPSPTVDLDVRRAALTGAEATVSNVLATVGITP